LADIKRKLPWYLSDYKDAMNMQCVATICFMYFALLAPIVTFGGLLEEATHQRMVWNIIKKIYLAIVSINKIFYFLS
jgi:hypothetical protein